MTNAQWLRFSEHAVVVTLPVAVKKHCNSIAAESQLRAFSV